PPLFQEGRKLAALPWRRPRFAAARKAPGGGRAAARLVRLHGRPASGPRLQIDGGRNSCPHSGLRVLKYAIVVTDAAGGGPSKLAGTMRADEGRSRLGRGLAALMGDVGEESKTVERGTRNQRRMPIEFLHPNPRNPRTNFSEAELDALAGSIKERGIIQ